jgi:putative FmdB family regulatory protein
MPCERGALRVRLGSPDLQGERGTKETMPTYEYECEQCGHHFDEFQSILADPLKTCPQCGEDRLRRLFGCGSAIIFKGSGFYQTDYRSESYKAGAKADQPATTSGGGTDSPGGNTGSNGKGAGAGPAPEAKTT